MEKTLNATAGVPLGLDVFPLELMNIIFQYMASDKATIAACTLVSRNWRDMAVPYLFHSIERVRQTALNDFGGFLDTHPQIARCIRTLGLNGISDPLGSVPAVVSLVDLVALRAKLPGLQKLSLHEIFFAAPTTDSFTAPVTSAAKSLARLEQLVVVGCFDESKPILAVSLPALISLVQSLPADSITLCSLLIADVPSSDPQMDKISNPTSRLRVRELTLDHLSSCRRGNYDMGHLYDALRQVLAPGCLQLLRTRAESDSGPDPESMRSFGELVHSTAGTLLHLGLPFSLRHPVQLLEDAPDYWRILRLHECRRLRSFMLWIEPPLLRSLSTARGTPNRQHIPLSAMIIALLDNLPSETLRTLTLALCDEVEPVHIKHRKLGLGALDDALSETRRYPSLEKVRIVLGDEYDYEPSVDLDAVSEAAREVMPKCEQRGILVIELELANL